MCWSSIKWTPSSQKCNLSSSWYYTAEILLIWHLTAITHILPTYLPFHYLIIISLSQGKHFVKIDSISVYKKWNTYRHESSDLLFVTCSHHIKNVHLAINSNHSLITYLPSFSLPNYFPLKRKTFCKDR